MAVFDPSKLSYTTDWNELVELIKNKHMVDISKRFKNEWDLVTGDPYFYEADDTIEYFITEVGRRNYFPIVAKVK